MKRLILIFLIQACAFSFEDYFHKTLLPTKKYEYERKANALTLGYLNSGVEIDHNEVYDNASLSSLSHKNNISVHTLQAQYERQFFLKSRVSITVLAGADYKSGRASELIDENTTKYYDKVNGWDAFAGAKINLNVEILKYQWQFFIGANSYLGKSSYALKYYENVDGSKAIDLKYKQDETYNILQTGFRIINQRTNLFSTFHVDYRLNENIKSSLSATYHGSPIQASNESIIKANSLGFGVGIGQSF